MTFDVISNRVAGQAAALTCPDRLLNACDRIEELEDDLGLETGLWQAVMVSRDRLNARCQKYRKALEKIVKEGGDQPWDWSAIAKEALNDGPN